MPPAETWVRWMVAISILIGVPVTVSIAAVASGTVTSSDVAGTPLEPIVADMESDIEETREGHQFHKSEAELLIHERVNEVRTERGLAPLRRNPILADEAQAHSEDMVERDFYSHTNPDGEGPQDRTATGCGIGENLAVMYWQTSFSYDGETMRLESEEEFADHAVQGWMDSPGHRENILNPRYISQGIGIAVDGDEVYVTQMFCAPP